MGTLQKERASLVAGFVGSLLLTCVAAICEAPQGPYRSSYDVRFFIPFPEVNPNTAVTTDFQYRVYVTNPETFTTTVTVTQTASDGSSQSTLYDIIEEATEILSVPLSFMMQGEGVFKQHLEINSTSPVSVQVLGTEDMDGFVALPVKAWDKMYRPVTNWVEFGGQAVIVIIADQPAQLSITIPAQDSKHLSIYDTINPAQADTEAISLAAGEVYQLKRDYDLTGCLISSDVNVGVVSGSEFTWIGEGSEDGAVYDWVPGRSKQGTDFIVTLTPGRAALGDVVLVMALKPDTNVLMSTDTTRISLNNGHYVMRRFHDWLIHVQSDLPITVVKFSQSGGVNGVTGHPTMTYIPPLALYLRDQVFYIKEMEGFISMEQKVTVVGTAGALECVAANLGVSAQTSSLHGTNFVQQEFTMATGQDHMKIECPNVEHPLGVFHYFSCSDFSLQTSVASSQSTISPPCQVTPGSAGDNIDNDCDGERDEDQCSPTPGSSADCEATWTGDLDAAGTSFTFLIPDHCYVTTESISLLVTSATEKEIGIIVKTPLDPGLIFENITKPQFKYDTEIILGANSIKAQTSEIHNTTILVTADHEISCILQMACPTAGTISAVATRLIPNEALGVEYYAITVCRTGACHIQISAMHVGITSVRIRVRLQGALSMLFDSRVYEDGEVICVQLDQFQSAQLRIEEGDLTGTHILSDKPVSVMSGGQLTNFINQHYKDGLLEQLPPVRAWGWRHFVAQTPKMDFVTECNTFACRDYLKIVASVSNTMVSLISAVNGQTDHVITYAGDSILLELPDAFVRLDSNAPVLMLQITQELLFGLEMSASLVLPPGQWTHWDRLPVPSLSNLELYLILVTGSTGVSSDDVLVNDNPTPMHAVTVTNGSFYRGSLAVASNHIQLEFLNATVGGQLHAVGGGMAAFYPLFFGVYTLNEPCQVIRGSRGDGIDNDCDGLVDEEPCVFNDLASDTDQDGMVNEDCGEQESSSILPTSTLSAISSMLMTSSAMVDLTMGPSYTGGVLPPAPSLWPLATDTLLSLLSSDPVTFAPAVSPSELSSSNVIVISSTEELAMSSPSSLEIQSSMALGSSESVTPSSSSSTAVVTSSSTAQVTSSTAVVTTTQLYSSSGTSSLVLSSSTVTSLVSSTVCACQCPNNLLSTPLDSGQIEQMTSSIQKELYVNKREVSATKRRYISVNDQRPSAQTVGYFGVCIVAVTFAGIFLLDITSLGRDIMELVNSCKREV